MRPIIALLTDFGLRDAFVASMKGLILSICSDVEIVDVTHEVNRFDVLHGALVLSSAARYFPEGTIFVGVVDPGVGTRRRGIVIETERHIAVGPDNGLLSLLAEKEDVKGVYEIRRKELTLDAPFETFHGLTVFSSVAAHIAKGVPPSLVGPRVEEYVRIRIPKPEVAGSEITARIIHVDQFGNLVTNVDLNTLRAVNVKEGARLRFKFKGGGIEAPFEKAYGYVPEGECVCVLDSYEFLELAVNQGDASKKLGLGGGDVVKITVLPER
ncbi:MAG: SAM hydrolase/SAM-dependent halogenase family protein [Candidatus Freyarchaeota archaeon]